MRRLKRVVAERLYLRAGLAFRNRRVGNNIYSAEIIYSDFCNYSIKNLKYFEFRFSLIVILLLAI